MRQIAKYGAIWLGSAVAAALVATQGVSMVGDRVTESRSAPLSSSDIQAALARGDSPLPTTSATNSGTVPTTLPPVTTSASVPATTTSVATSSPPPSSTSVSPQTTITTPPGPTTPTLPPTTTTATTLVPAETRTYNLVGGVATLRFRPTLVEVVVANPRSGFDVEVSVDDQAPHGVQVEFESESSGHKSRVDGWWEDGPRDRVREEPG